MTFNWPTCAIPSSTHLKKQSKLQHFDVRLTLSSWQLTSFVIHRRLLFAMASRRFTVDPAKKKKFLNFILQMPKLRVPDAMNWQCSLTRTWQILDWGASSSVPSQGAQWKQWRCTLVHSFHPNHHHLVVTTNAKSGWLMNWLPHHQRQLPNQSMTSCPLKWINWLQQAANRM